MSNSTQYELVNGMEYLLFILSFQIPCTLYKSQVMMKLFIVAVSAFAESIVNQLVLPFCYSLKAKNRCFFKHLYS